MGAADVAIGSGITARIDWGGASVPQVETYFERYHGKPIAAVRQAAQAILAADPDVVARRFAIDGHAELERTGGALSISLKVSEGRRLAVYAKAPDRIRFENQRRSRGRYDRAQISGPIDRLLSILRQEREEAIRAFDWPAIGELFGEPGTPYLADLTELIGIIIDICEAVGLPARPIVQSIVTDGGCSPSGPSPVPQIIIDRLCARGVLSRVKIRRVTRPRQARRYSLTVQYREVQEALLRSVPIEPPDATE